MAWGGPVISERMPLKLPKTAIRAITIDLDDTLWPGDNTPVMVPDLEAFGRWLENA